MAAAEDPISDGGLEFRKFRETEPKWSKRIGDDWTYEGLIHIGRSCLIARYCCKDKDPPHTKDIAVKFNHRRVGGNRIDGYPAGYDDFKLESQFLEALSGLYERDNDAPGTEPRRPQGILRQYCSQWVIYGARELGRNEVSFLEYCPGVNWENMQFHDLGVFDRKGVPHLSEIDIWMIFKQFTRMIMMLDCGNEVVMHDEDLNSRQPPDWIENEICHYDIEPRNILIGYREDDEDRVPMLKLCDFGDALQVPSLNVQNHGGRYRFPNQPENGREGFRVPEAVIGNDEFLQPFRHGSCSNVFQFANIIRCLMHQDQSEAMHVHPEDEEWIAALPRQYKLSGGKEKSGKNAKDELPLSYGIIHDDLTEIYGGDLRRLVSECMRESPSLRPDVKTLWLRVRNGYEASIEGREGPHDPDQERRTFPPLHPIFAATEVARSSHWRTAAPGWADDDLPMTPECLSPDPPIDDFTLYENAGDDLPEEIHAWPRSIPQVPLRVPHGPPVLESRPTVNVPERVGDVPGTITRNLQMMEYYDRMGHMWMGEENYWKMLEAGLDPDTYDWEMRIPDPERDFNQEPLSGTEYDEGDSEEDWDKWRDGRTHK
ncbi:hypothetical protein MFRU_010g00600 [Monilinia fructicola]|nr:hypothetical protein MFRU_010g00600 [Monilinia fructicola]